MVGYAARTEPSTGTHDPLTARALDLTDAVLVVLDVCGLTAATCRRVAEQVRPDDPGAVHLLTTHTHAGPECTPGRLGGCRPEVEQALVEAAVTACRRAAAARVPCTLHRGSARGAGVARNRRHPDREVDPPVDVLRCTDADGRVRAVLVGYACHPVVLDASNRQLSADFVHGLRTEVEEALPGAVAVFATGCAGDLNDGHPAEASYTTEPDPARGFAAAEEIGRRLGRLAVAAPTRPLSSPVVTVRRGEVELELQQLEDAAVSADVERWRRRARQAPAGERALLASWIDWAEHRVPADRYTVPVALLGLGDLSLALLPGEPFWRTAEELTAALPGDVVVLGYADDCPGYLPTREEYQHGGYEVADAHRYYGMPAPFAPGSAERLVASVVSLAASPTWLGTAPP
nr:alkaline ceramidase [Auraticoccus cholistanensis]